MSEQHDEIEAILDPARSFPARRGMVAMNTTPDETLHRWQTGGVPSSRLRMTVTVAHIVALEAFVPRICAALLSDSPLAWDQAGDAALDAMHYAKGADRAHAFATASLCYVRGGFAG